MINLDAILGYTFKNRNLLTKALTHKSFVKDKTESNERLEFLGDAVLELVVTEYLINRFKKTTEGELSKIRAACVNSESLSEISKNLGIFNFMRVGRSEQKEHIELNNSILENVFEAIIGAVYLDGGLEAVRDFIIKHITKRIDKIIKNKDIFDHKTYLQEFTQKHLLILPEYKIIKEKGAEHDKTFYCEVFINKKSYGVGVGKSKKLAEKEAARIAISKLQSV